jgi:hypothetical protein
MLRFLVTCIVIAVCHAATAQNPVLLECVKMNKAYIATDHLSFNIKYSYANDTTPTIVEDSSFATYKIHGYKYWASMDSVEFMQNDSFQVVAYKPEQVLSLALPAYNHGQTLPLSHWDSLFNRNNEFTYAFSVDAGYKKLTVDFSKDQYVKKYELWYDSVTYRIHHVRYKMDDGAGDELMVQQGLLSGNVIVIDMLFSNYQTGMFTDAVFNSGNYFYKSGTEYLPVGGFSTYEVFLASVGL